MGGSLQHWVLLCEPHRRWVEGEPTYGLDRRLPLVQDPKLVIQYMLHSCPELTEKLDGSGVYLAMDNFFTSHTLLFCLETHKIYGVGTVRMNRIGLKRAAEVFQKRG